jgi:hypothetical protein
MHDISIKNKKFIYEKNENKLLSYIIFEQSNKLK